MNMSKFLDKMRRNAPDVPGGSPAPAPTPDLPVGGDTAAPSAPAVQPAGADFSFIPADFHVDGKPDLGKFTAHYQELVAADAQRKQALADVPEDGQYQFGLPKDLKFEGLDLPEGFTYELATDDPSIKPLFDQLGAVMKEYGLPRAAAEKFTGLLAQYEALKFSQGYAAVKAEMAALGTQSQAQARIQTVERKLQTMLPPDQVEALKSISTSAKAVMALEKILSPASLSAPSPQPPTADRENLSAYERLKLANAQGRR